MTTTWYERDDAGNYWAIHMDSDRSIAGTMFDDADTTAQRAAAADHYYPGTRSSLDLRLAVMVEGSLEPLESFRHRAPAPWQTPQEAPAQVQQPTAPRPRRMRRWARRGPWWGQ